MAEIGIAGSLIGITSAAISLTKTLYVFGSTTSAAREQVDYIGKNVSFYSDVLELLAEQFEHDRPIHSEKAVALAEKLHDHSHDLFDRIYDLIPDGRRVSDHISLMQKIAWNFKKTKVDFLVGELENLKSTVHLLVQVLCAARQIHAYQADAVKPTEQRKRKKREAVNRQCARAENVIIEWQRTQENLPVLKDAAERSDLLSIQAGSRPTQPDKGRASKDTGVLTRSDKTALTLIQAATTDAAGSESDKRALVLQSTANWLKQLIDEWTVPYPEREQGPEDNDLRGSRNIKGVDSVPRAEKRVTNESKQQAKTRKMSGRRQSSADFTEVSNNGSRVHSSTDRKTGLYHDSKQNESSESGLETVSTYSDFEEPRGNRPVGPERENSRYDNYVDHGPKLKFPPKIPTYPSTPRKRTVPREVPQISRAQTAPFPSESNQEGDKVRSRYWQRDDAGDLDSKYGNSDGDLDPNYGSSDEERWAAGRNPEKVGNEKPYHTQSKRLAMRDFMNSRYGESREVEVRSISEEGYGSNIVQEDRDWRKYQSARQSRQAYVEDHSTSDSDTAPIATVRRYPDPLPKANYDPPRRERLWREGPGFAL